MNSCLYRTEVFHERLTPKVHRFSYSQFMFCIDLSEVNKLHKQSSFFSNEHNNLYSLKHADHYPYGHNNIRDNIKSYLYEHHDVDGIENITLLTQLRSGGFLFNPVSFYFLEDKKGQDKGVLAEVMNTFREFKMYYLPPSTKDGLYYQDQQNKHFYISPFSELNTSLVFKLQRPSKHMHIEVNEKNQDNKLFFRSHLSGTKLEWTDLNILNYTFKYPMSTLLSFIQIHIQAYKLFKKRVSWHKKENNKHLQRDTKIPYQPKPSFII